MGFKNLVVNVLISVLLASCHLSVSKEIDKDFLLKVEQELEKLMEQGDIPGLSLVIIKGDRQFTKSYGYSDLEKQVPINSNTLFEIGSCSKAFTALAITDLELKGRINLDDKVSDYLPWFKVSCEDAAAVITLRQLLHHTSGIPWETIAKIPPTNAPDALEQTVRQLIGQELDDPPGKEYLYATINYDVLALIVQVVTGQPFEEYIQTNIIDQLQLNSTTIGEPKDSTLLSNGHKIGFFAAREYDAPVYKGNNAAGYVISNAKDMTRWVKFQMGMVDTELYEAAKVTHYRDETVALHGMSSYARGWNVALDGTGEIYHGGLNPNFTSYITLRPRDKLAIAILANSNSNYTAFIGNKLMKLLAGEEIERELDPGDRNDKTYSSISIALVIYIMVVISFLLMIVVDVVKKRRTLQGLSLADFGRFVKSFALILPFLLGLYLLPKAIAGFTWEAISVWSPISFTVLIGTILAAIAFTYFAYLISLCFPEKNQYKRKAPQILLISILSGLSNVAVIIMVTSAIDSDAELKYLIFYYGLIISVYLAGRRFVQINLIKFTRGLVYDLRIKLIQKIFSTSYDKFEKMDRGRIYTALNDDVNTIGRSTNLFVSLATSIITAIGAFLYLASIAFWATVLTISLIATLSTIYYFAVQSTNIYFEEARDSQNVFMRLINGMIDGFKEISLHRNKKLEYKEDVAASAREYKEKISTADIRFVNAFLVGESLLVILLGVVSIGMSELFPNIQWYAVMSFVIVLLYLIGPINGILNSVPALMTLRIAWRRINQFIKEIPANLDLNLIPEPLFNRIDQLEAKGVEYQFENEEGDKNGFRVGPINLEVSSGEILFIIGGNGSGKTTLAKLLTGLYEPDKGHLLINNTALKNSQLSEYYSTVFSPSYLFEKLYNCDIKDRENEIKQYLNTLDLEDKVEIVDNRYSTIMLSGGQRKRLALLQCYIENSPIYLFDEWAADQDPEYRNFFYRTLLPEMKKLGKIIIAITHDDHYFDVADKVLKMNRGKLEVHSGENLWNTVEL